MVQGLDRETEDADALLIAAAPEMLAELQHLLKKHGYQSTADVIARATGQTTETAR